MKPRRPPVVLVGIDPGLASTGYGVVRREGARYRCLDYGCIRTRAETELGERLLQIHGQVTDLLKQHHPEVMVLERLYQLRDGSTGLSVGQAIGVVRLAATQAGVPVVEYTPTHVKMTLVGTGAAEKEQVQFMVQRLLGLDQPPKPDHAGDALALCVCHVHSGLSRSSAGSDRSGLPPAAESRIERALREDDERRRAHLKREGLL